MTEAEYNRAWPRVRLTILARDGYRCQVSGPRCKGEATEVDHIIPVREGGSLYDPRNLRSICRPCHNMRKGRDLVIVSERESGPSRDW